MRFLCLHGHGTSVAIFKMQTAAIRYELGSDHTYEFVEGVQFADMAPGLESISDPDTQHYAFYNPHSPSDFIAALDQLEEYISSEGPFDGVLAFSQGAGLAAMHIVRKCLAGEAPPFKCAILFSSEEVYDPKAWLEHGITQPLDTQVHGRPITIPTAVIYGEKDPYGDRSQRIANLCDPEKVFVLQHPGSHEVPGLGVKDSVPKAVKIIKRALTQAMLQY